MQLEITSFVTTLLSATRDYWSANQSPLLLSHLPAIFANLNVDYRAELAGESLKAFVERTSGDATYKVATHPVHRAKIGLVPPEVNFEFDVKPEPALEAGLSEMACVENDAITLLKILRKLDAEDLEKIQIPVSVLAKLFKKP